MNKIEVTSNKELVNESFSTIDINNGQLIIKINSSQIEPITLINNVYRNITFIIENKTHVTIIEVKDNHANNEYFYNYILGEESYLSINKFYYADEYRENDKVDLNGYGSSIAFNLSTICHTHQTYNVDINHNNKKTVSNICNHGVTLGDGSLDFIINGSVKRGMSDSILNQDNKIMTMGNSKSTIKPNLFIDENMVEARHGASIGRFNEEEIFYLQTRGISKGEGYLLLVKGFLLQILSFPDDIKKELVNIIEKLGGDSYE
jgi:Fe-S cluster assembly scaffold protein SufB